MIGLDKVKRCFDLPLGISRPNAANPLMTSNLGRVSHSPLKGSVIDSNLSLEGIFIILNTAKVDKTPLIVLGSLDLIRVLRVPGIIVGSPPARPIGITSVTNTGWPDTKCWTILVHSFKYITVNDTPLDFQRIAILDPNFLYGAGDNCKLHTNNLIQ